METLLTNLLLFLSVIWLLLGITYLGRKLWYATPSSAPEKSTAASPSPMVTQEQIAHARHVLVGKSKPFVSPKPSEAPAISSPEQTEDNQPTFARPNVHPTDETALDTAPPSSREMEEETDDDELQIDYTMDEPDEDSILREELQIADEALPEVSQTALLFRDLARITHWHKADDTLGEEDEQLVQSTLQSLRGTMLMEQLKENTLKQEHDHHQLLSAIRKAEEAEMKDEVIAADSTISTDGEGTAGEAERPLSYYL